ncbi:MAG: hypothetical protein JST70_14100 [Bacteroidetes bacterium]|nr:hypothetical protein [Bacteroidota bacterium]
MKHLKLIWKDPVWSKVIATVIVGIATYIGCVILAQFNHDTTTIANFTKLWTFNLPLWVVAIIVLTTILIPIVYKLCTSAFKYDDHTLELDKHLFNKIINTHLPANGSIDWLRGADFHNGFRIENMDELDGFEGRKNDPHFEFLNPKLEEIKKRLLGAVENFSAIIGLNTFPANNPNFQEVPRNWEQDQIEDVVRSLHTEKGKICDEYDNLVKSGRRILKM